MIEVYNRSSRVCESGGREFVPAMLPVAEGFEELGYFAESEHND